MPRPLRRAVIVFTVFALGLVLAGWGSLRVIATRVLADTTEPLRLRVVADWAAHADELDRQLALVAALPAPSAPAPDDLACHLVWTGASAAVKAHREKCTAPEVSFTADELAQLEQPGAVLPERDLSWLAALPGHTDWSAGASPLAHLDVDPRTGPPPALLPTVSLPQTVALATLRLARGDERARDEVLALGQALLSRPLVADQLAGLAVLERARKVAGVELASPTDAQLAALRTTLVAASQLWSPWVPKEQRARFLPKLTPASRCAATAEALSALELGLALGESYGEWVAELAAWRTDGCRDAVIARALDARRTVADERFFDAARRVELVDRGSTKEAVLQATFPRSALVRRAALESVLSLSAVRAFPEAKP